MRQNDGKLPNVIGDDKPLVKPMMTMFPDTFLYDVTRSQWVEIENFSLGTDSRSVLFAMSACIHK